MRPIRAALVMHSTRSDNLGVGALTVSEVEILRGIGRDLGRAVEIAILDWPDPRTPYVSGSDVEVVTIRGRDVYDPRRYLAEVRRADLMVDIGAGDSFADIYGAKRLRTMFAMKALAHLARVPVVVAPQTIGPFTKPGSRRLARLTLNRSAIVATRDRLSTEAARALGVTRPIIEASDVALELPYDPPAPRAAGGPPRVGLNVSGLLMSGGYTRANEFGLTLDYPALVRDLIRLFQGRGAEVHLVAHVLPEDVTRRRFEDDYAPSRELAAEFPGVVLAPPARTPSDAKTYIAGMDFFLGARMHACIAAFSSGVPVVPMAYSRKFAGLFGSLGYEETVDCTRGSNADILAAAERAYDRREALAAEGREALARGRAKLALYKDALRDLMARVPKG